MEGGDGPEEEDTEIKCPVHVADRNESSPVPGGGGGAERKKTPKTLYG